ncbi:MAG: adenylate kinase [Flavobacteriales bacterium]|nr:adenylate kinase [Flavobacteriales bacterium]
MVNIVLFGPPGSGKGTQAEKLTERFNLKHISTGDLFRYNLKNETELGKLAKSYMDKGNLVPDEVTSSMLKAEVLKNKDAKGFIFDGFPRTTAQAQFLDEFLTEINTSVLMTLSLDVEDKVLVERLLERGKTSGRADDSNQEIIENRIKEYYEKTAPVADFYKNQNKWIEVKGVGTIQEINDNLASEIDSKL